MEIWLVVIVTICFPPILLSGFFIVNPREEMVVLRFGKYVGTVKNEGIRWVHPVVLCSGEHAQPVIQVQAAPKN